MVFTVVFYLLYALGSPTAVRLRAGTGHEFARAWSDGSPVLQFTPEERNAGEELLDLLGLPNSGSHMCFGLRDDAYYSQFRDQPQRGRLNLEAATKFSVRNPALNDYMQMAVDRAEAGLYAVRMGSVVGEPLPAGLHPRVVDYASQCRTPFGDVYLLATCKFAVAGASALWLFASVFNRPIVQTDSYYLQFRPCRPGDLFIPIKLWLIEERRFLTFREMLETDIDLTSAVNLQRSGLELVHNTPDEISAVVREMDQRIDGTWLEAEEDEELQRRFGALYQPAHDSYGMPGCIGAEFLRQHSYLL
jgi:putative glycosyltransferase (TIGR04372 family)